MSLLNMNRPDHKPGICHIYCVYTHTKTQFAYVGVLMIQTIHEIQQTAVFRFHAVHARSSQWIINVANHVVITMCSNIIMLEISSMF